MRIVFFGTPEWAVPALSAVAATRHVLSLVVTQPTRRRGRGGAVTPSPVAAAAALAKIPIFEPPTVKTPQFLARLAQERPDLLIVVAYGRIFPKGVLDLPPLGAVNIHFSLLPKYRGAAPVQWAIANGETETGVTIMKMSEEMDAGPIYAQARVPIEEREHASTLGARLAPLGAELLVSLLEDLDEKRIEARPQDEHGVTVAPMLRPEDGWIDWDLPAAAIERRIRGFDPWPGQSAATVKGKVRVLEARARAAETGGADRDGSAQGAGSPAGERAAGAPVGTPSEPGFILGMRGEALEVACGEGTVLEAIRIQPEGRRAILGAEAIRGRYLRVGERFSKPPSGA
jgi:methionyl-tRNA formyltransferase